MINCDSFCRSNNLHYYTPKTEYTNTIKTSIHNM